MRSHSTKKFLLALLFAIIFGTMALGVADAATTEDGYYFSVSYEGEATITGYKGEDTVLKIPSSVHTDSGDFPVTKIRREAFKYLESVTEAVIPSGVVEIGYYAFSGCSSLVSISLSDSLAVIGEGAFMDCRNLKSVAIPSGVSRIEPMTFYGCGMLESVSSCHIDQHRELFVFSLQFRVDPLSRVCHGNRLVCL